jgi:hypothetical protein
VYVSVSVTVVKPGFLTSEVRNNNGRTLINLNYLLNLLFICLNIVKVAECWKCKWVHPDAPTCSCTGHIQSENSLSTVIGIKFGVETKKWTYILIYIQQDATLHSLFISGNCSTCVRWFLHPSSGAHTTVTTVSGTCQTVTATCCYCGRVPTLQQ